MWPVVRHYVDSSGLALAFRSGVPHVSVIVPAWNAAAFIGRAVESVIAQTYPDWDLIVVNDGSSDTPALEAALDRYAPHANPRYVAQPNGGPSAARNRAIGLTGAEFVAFLDADDWWEPSYLRHQLSQFEHDPSLDVVYCDAWLTGDSGLDGRTFMELSPSTGEVTLERLLALECNVPTTCVVARRETVVAAGLFDESLRRCEDYHLWARMVARGARFAYSRDVLAHHRIHEASAMGDKSAMFEAQRVMFSRLADWLGPSHPASPLAARQIRRAEADLALERSKRYLRAREYSKAVDAINTARAYYPGARLRLASLALRTLPGVVRQVYLARQ